MSQVVINDSSLSDIANSIRKKNGRSDTYKPSEMSEAIDNIQAAKPEQTKTITKNGIVTPDTGYTLSSVLVSIPVYSDLS